MLCRQQLRNLTENKESELQCLFQQIERQEQLLDEIHREKRGVLVVLSFFFVYIYGILILGLEKNLLLLHPVWTISKPISFSCLCLLIFLHFWDEKRKFFSHSIHPVYMIPAFTGCVQELIDKTYCFCLSKMLMFTFTSVKYVLVHSIHILCPFSSTHYSRYRGYISE